MFKTHANNIPQIIATIKEYKECWFHGCGNIYVDKKNSDDRQQLTNPASQEATYRIHFTSVSEVPKTKEALDKLLLSSRNQEIVKENTSKVSQGIRTIKVEAEGLPDVPKEQLTPEEIEFQKMLDAEKSGK